eukprot:SAG31_NODE_3816_length_3856_cov_2.615917_2_plen_199_part_00
MLTYLKLRPCLGQLSFVSSPVATFRLTVSYDDGLVKLNKPSHFSPGETLPRYVECTVRFFGQQYHDEIHLCMMGSLSRKTYLRRRWVGAKLTSRSLKLEWNLYSWSQVRTSALVVGLRDQMAAARRAVESRRCSQRLGSRTMSGPVRQYGRFSESWKTNALLEQGSLPEQAPDLVLPGFRGQTSQLRSPRYRDLDCTD